MKYSTRRQKDKDIHGFKVFMVIIFILVMTLFLVVLGERGSVVQVGLHLPLWPQTINNVRATSEFSYNNVYSEGEGMRMKFRGNLSSLTRAEGHSYTSSPKPARRPGQHNDLGVLNEESGDRQTAVRTPDSSTHLEDAETTTVKSGGDLLLLEQSSSNAPSGLIAPRDHLQEVQFAEQGKGWIQFPYIAANETEQLMLQIRQNGTLPCHGIRTQSAQILGLPQPSKLEGDREPVILLHAGPVYELTIVSIGDDGQPRCAGGDYYETDLSGPLWKSRPPVLDCNNGTYSVRLQMDPGFASGLYTFKIILLFSNFHALHYHPHKWARVEEVATYQIKFVVPTPTSFDFRPKQSHSVNSSSDSKTSSLKTEAPSPDLPICKLEDFNRKYWSGRWTRRKATKDCDYDRFGRWVCVDVNLKCQKPWCQGAVGRLESNGWVYSAHCAFKIFEKEEAWKCLAGKWLFFWGDSNHIDTIRNLLNFVLGFEHKIRVVDRRMDTTYLSPLNNRSSVRITSMFNGHSNVSKNYEGLHSLHDPAYAEQLRSFFTGETAPDFMIMNSGLHDGVYWRDINRYMSDGVEFAVDFWARVWSGMKARRPDLFYRTTVSTGGNARNMSFNPHKMELFNHLIVDRFLRMELERFHIIDGFDYTYPWHFDHKTNDGVHYGRPPARSKWAGGNIGHRYFVDLMLAHMLLNAMCAPSSHSTH